MKNFGGRKTDHFVLPIFRKLRKMGLPGSGALVLL